MLDEIAVSGSTELAGLEEADRKEYFRHLSRLPVDKEHRRRNVSSVIMETEAIQGTFPCMLITSKGLAG